MRVLIVIWSIQIGGGETFAVDLCVHLRSKGFDPFLFPVTNSWDERFLERIQRAGVTVVSPFLNPVWNWVSWKINALLGLLGMNQFRESRTKAHFRSTISKLSIDAVISNSLVADYFVAKNLPSNLPFVVVEHGEYSYSLKDGKEIDWQPISKASHVVCVSDWCKQMISKRIATPMTVIYNGHHGAETRGTFSRKINSKAFVFGMLGRGISHKGWQEAVSAFLIVQKSRPNCRLVLVGDGEEIQRLKQTYGFHPNIVFTGRMANPESVVRQIDVGLVPSRKYEAFGIVLLDFFCHGKPVVASHVGGIPEVVSFKGLSGGILIPVNQEGKADTISLASAMLELVEDQSLYKEKSSHASEIYEHFSFQSTGEKYEKILKSLRND